MLFANHKISRPKKQFLINQEYFPTNSRHEILAPTKLEILNDDLKIVDHKITKVNEESEKEAEEIDSEQDQAEMEFQNYKKLMKIEEKEIMESEEDKFSDISDDDTNTLIPDAKDVIYCKYDNVIFI